MLGRALRHRSLGRLAIAGLSVGLVAFAGLAGTEALLATRTTREVRRIDTEATQWNLLLVDINTEDGALRKYLVAETYVGQAPLLGSIGSAYPVLDSLFANGSRDNQDAEVQFRLSYDIHTRNLRQLVLADSDADRNTVQLLATNDVLTSSALLDQATDSLNRNLQQLSATARRADRRNRRIRDGAAPIFAVDMALLGLCALLLLAHQRRIGRQADDSRHQAQHDALTGVANRVLLMEQLDQALGQADPLGRYVGLLLLDLDRFKEVNDTLGHHAGDLLLCEVAGRLTGLVRGDDTVARLGGDEFAVLLPTTAHESDAADVARRMLDALTLPVVLGGRNVAVSGSIGAAVAERGSCTPAELLQHADIAMYRAKRAGLGVAVFQPGDEESVALHLTLTQELREAIAAGQLTVHYQPKVSMDGAVHAVEALVRWQHPERGLLGPGEFVPLAESSGLIEELTDAVLRIALSDQARWRSEGIDLSVAVNIAAPSLMGLGLQDRVAELMALHGTPAARLGIEITESAVLADPRRAVVALTALRSLGILISIDDFGTGYASMAHLLTLPLDELKVDRTFVAALDQRTGLAIVRATIELGHALGLDVVAEGVESESTLEILRQLGCDSVQGYLLCAPVPSDHLLSWLNDRIEPPEPRHEAPAASPTSR